MTGPYPRRPSAIAERGMVATSQPLATQAGLRALEDGGTAVDAAICAAAVLCVVEPMMTGLGGDAFAIVHRDGKLDGLNSSGRAPAAADPDTLGAIPIRGPLAVTVPGAVAGWAALAERHGRLGLDRLLRDAIEIAERGFAVTPVIAGMWQADADALAGFPEAARTWLPAPRAGELRRLPELARTLREVAEHGPDGFYRGRIAEAICAASPLSSDDLTAHRAEWVEPLRVRYRGVEVCELPPNGQGAAALQALGMLDCLELPADEVERVHQQAEAAKLAFADAYRHIHDGPLPAGYLDPSYLAERAGLIEQGRAGSPAPGDLPRGGTVYLCAVDHERTACSLIQSIYYHFGSLVVAPGTGVTLQNRGACFTLEPGHPNRLAAGKRPFHTIIPGMLVEGASLIGPFGLMGGHMQPQGHLQLVSQLIDRGLDPQAAIDEPRFRLDLSDGDWTLALEAPLWRHGGVLGRRGHRVLLDPDPTGFGGAQAILVHGDALIGGSESRKDGVVLGR